MPKSNKKIVFILIAILLVAFFVFSIPNSKGSKDSAMVSMFEPDEGVCLPVVLNMISPKGDFLKFIWKFVFYDFYSYGFPFFATSSLVLLPLQWLGRIQDTSLAMLIVRQMISVLPMLLALLLLVYIQDKFQTYRSVVLYVFLLSIPALIQNGFWWHPDGLVILLAVLVLFFLWKDNRKFGWRFFAAAITCGVLVATKMVGVYFFLAVGMTLIWGLVEKKITFKKFITLAFLFILIMLAAFILANPFLLSKWARDGYFFTMGQETRELTQGYGLVYKKGIMGAWPTMHAYYGEAVFLIMALGVTLWGIWKKQERFLYALTLAWFIPLTISLFVVTHFKYQYWMPVVIPVISNLIILLPQNISDLKANKKLAFARVILLAIMTLQFALFVKNDVASIISRANRQENNPRIEFYDQAIKSLQPVVDKEMVVYYDYRLYVPEIPGWKISTSYDLLTYQYIIENKFDIVFLLESRIQDYINPNAVGVDPQELEISRKFYNDAEAGKIKGYHLLFKNDTAQLYILKTTCHTYFTQENCD